MDSHIPGTRRRLDGHRTRNVFARLSLEWAVVGSSARARRAVATWAHHHPVLAGHRSPFALTEARRQRLVGDERDAVFAALVDLAPGDELAAQAALEALTPGLFYLAFRYGRGRAGMVGQGRTWETLDELDHDIVSFAASRLRAGHAAGRDWPAGRLLDGVRWDLRYVVETHRRAHNLRGQGGTPLVLHDLDVHDIDPDDLPESHDSHPAARLAGILVDAVARQVVPEATAAVVYTTAVLGHPDAAVTTATGASASAVRQRRSRGIRELAAAVADGRLPAAS